jgi:hypothetical protein
VRILTQPSIINPDEVMQIEDKYDSPDWEKDIIKYLHRGELPEDRKKSRRILKNEIDF